MSSTGGDHSKQASGGYDPGVPASSTNSYYPMPQPQSTAVPSAILPPTHISTPAYQPPPYSYAPQSSTSATGPSAPSAPGYSGQYQTGGPLSSYPPPPASGYPPPPPSSGYYPGAYQTQQPLQQPQPQQPQHGVTAQQPAVMGGMGTGQQSAGPTQVTHITHHHIYEQPSAAGAAGHATAHKPQDHDPGCCATCCQACSCCCGACLGTCFGSCFGSCCGGGDHHHNSEYQPLILADVVEVREDTCCGCDENACCCCGCLFGWLWCCCKE